MKINLVKCDLCKTTVDPSKQDWSGQPSIIYFFCPLDGINGQATTYEVCSSCRIKVNERFCEIIKRLTKENTE